MSGRWKPITLGGWVQVADSASAASVSRAEETQRRLSRASSKKQQEETIANITTDNSAFLVSLMQHQLVMSEERWKPDKQQAEEWWEAEKQLSDERWQTLLDQQAKRAGEERCRADDELQKSKERWVAEQAMKNTLLESLLASCDRQRRPAPMVDGTEQAQTEENARIARDSEFKLKQEMDIHRTAARSISKMGQDESLLLCLDRIENNLNSV